MPIGAASKPLCAPRRLEWATTNSHLSLLGLHDVSWEDNIDDLLARARPLVLILDGSKRATGHALVSGAVIVIIYVVFSIDLFAGELQSL